jgi:plastocyanin
MGSRIVAIAPLALVLFGAALVLGGSSALGPKSIATPVTRTISASTTVFIPTVLSVPGEMQVSLTFRNDSSEPHTFILLEPIGVGTDRVVLAGSSRTLNFTAPSPGDYTFVCNVHENMTGILRVE